LDEDGAGGEVTGGSEAVEEGGEAGGVSLGEEAADSGAFAEEVRRSFDVAARALDGLKGARAREAHPCQGLLVRQAVQEADGGHGEAHHGQQHQSGVEADQEGAETDTPHAVEV
jgi:hypothetical protein